jgi:hypothetical protein
MKKGSMELAQGPFSTKPGFVTTIKTAEKLNRSNTIYKYFSTYLLISTILLNMCITVYLFL